MRFLTPLPSYPVIPTPLKYSGIHTSCWGGRRITVICQFNVLISNPIRALDGPIHELPEYLPNFIWRSIMASPFRWNVWFLAVVFANLAQHKKAVSNASKADEMATWANKADGMKWWNREPNLLRKRLQTYHGACHIVQAGEGHCGLSQKTCINMTMAILNIKCGAA